MVHGPPASPAADGDPSATLADAVAWYANRLSPQARRPDANEIRQIFARIGLTDPFWDPQADRF